MTRPLRVLHCPYNVGGHPAGLARAERELGLDSSLVVFADAPGGHGGDVEVLRRGVGRLAFERRRLALLRRAFRNADVVHFNFGSTLLPMPATWDAGRLRRAIGVFGLSDVRLLRRAGKGIVVTFQGDDVRQGDVLRARYEHSIATAAPGYYDPRGDDVKRRLVRTFDRLADELFYLNPDLAHVLPARARFLPYASVDPNDWQPVPPHDRPRVVVHAPSDRAVKGTVEVIRALEQLEGVSLELVEGVSRDEARRVYERADLAVDQLYAGWYGGFAVELMALGKPVVANVFDEDLDVLPAEMRAALPLLRATPDTLVDVLREALRGGAVEAGRRARAYVERWHDPRAVAAETGEAYERAVSHASRRER